MKLVRVFTRVTPCESGILATESGRWCGIGCLDGGFTFVVTLSLLSRTIVGRVRTLSERTVNLGLILFLLIAHQLGDLSRELLWHFAK